MKRILLSIATTLALAAAAMPTRDEQRKAAPIVAELMDPLVADFRAKKKTAAEVGDVAMAYAKEANTEAAKFLLLKGAIWYFAQAKEDAKAVAAIAALGAEVKELPPEVLRNDVLKPAIDHVSEQNVPGLFAQFRSASAQMEIAKLGPSVRRNKADEPTRRRYAELLVVTGDWKGALDVFAQLDDAKDAAKDEIAGKTLAPAGDFWWNYRPTEPTAADAIKAHAVALYRKAIASGELTGLKKVVAEKRIASTPFADSFTVSAAGGTGRAANVSAEPRGGAPSNALYCVVDLSAGPTASNYPVKWLDTPPSGGFNTDEYKTTKLVLRRIAPGKFMMRDGQREVTLTKPFYCGVFEVTQKQYELVTGGNPSEYKGDMRPVENISWNMIRGDSATYNLPSSVNVDSSTFMGKIQTRTGLNFDLPTEAQWEYACRAGTTSKYNNSGDSVTDLKKLGRYEGNQSDGKGGYSQHTTVGSYQSNAWGLYDMHGNVWEFCLDGSEVNRVIRGGGWGNRASGCTPSSQSAVRPWRASGSGFRLCMNPEGPVGTSARGSGTLAASGSLYCVIDLSAGPTAGKYPVSYLAAEPKGGWTDEYKTTKLVLRRIEPGTFKMGGEYEVTLTKPYYMGVFEVTQKQYELVTGGNPSRCKGDMRPVEQVSWNTVHGDSSVYNWPSSTNVDQNSFMGKIKARTGLNFDLPTEAQWEYACRAGTTSQYNNGGDTEADLKKLGRFLFNQGARGNNETDESFAKHEPDGRGGCWENHTVVGSYQPNAWGLYDMHGNVKEWCLDWHGDMSGRATDPLGSSSGTIRVQRGGCWQASAATCTSSCRGRCNPSGGNWCIGFRLCMNPGGPVGAERATNVSAEPRGGAPSNALYCIIDLSAGANASKYPVSYLAAEPKGGWTDEYKTKKLVLRRIEPGKFLTADGKVGVTLTKPFYCGVFEVTQKQYELVTGDNPSEFRGDTRPVERVSWNMVRGDSSTYDWPSSVKVDPNSFMGKIQARTGLNFDLPTEAQWEYACRAGTTSKFNNGGDSEDDMKKLGRYKGNQSDGKGGYSQHTMVGSYQPNAWGLYDMHGNIREWCLDWHGNVSVGVDPLGPSSGTRRVQRGDCWNSGTDRCASSGRNHSFPWSGASINGFRLCMNPDGPVGAGGAANISAAPRDGAPSNALYCVVDLSAGANASKYPVSYLAAEPKGGFNTDEYKTTKLVLRRIAPGKFMMGGEHEVTITKPFYCGIFEVTQKQYALVTGGNPSQCKGDMRPVERVSWNMIRGDSSTYNWPSSVKVDPNSFMGKIQARTGLNFDLPTEAQWEYTCRAGTTGKYNNDGDTEADLKKLGRCKDNRADGKGGYVDARTTNVGSYQPNAWGLYDMHGNVWEWCLDWHGNLSGRATDPLGASSGEGRVDRGGCWWNYADRCTSSYRSISVPSSLNNGDGSRGFRLCMNPEGPVGVSAVSGK